MVQQVMHTIFTSPCEDGEGAARAMVFAMDEAEITPDKVDISMHMEQVLMQMTYLRQKRSRKH